MKNKLMTIRIFATILMTLVLAGQASFANAGIIDWFKGNDNENSVSLSSSMFLNSASSILGNIEINEKQAPTMVQDNFLTANANIAMGNKIPSIGKYSHAGDSLLANKKASQIITVPASAYSSTADQTDDTPFITANQTLVHDGVVAANFLPFGTKLRIPQLFGDKIFTVEDRMNKRYWQKIDIWFADRQSALEFGVRTIKIEIL